MSEQPVHSNVREATLVVVGTFLLAMILSMLFTEPFGIYGVALLELLMIGPTLVYIRYRQLPIRETLRLNRISSETLFYSAMTAVGCTAVVDEINRLVQPLFPIPEELARQMQELVTWDSPGEAAILFLGAVIFAAFTEELLFRGLYQSTLEREFDVTKAVILTSLLFTIVHLQPWAFIEFTVIGTLLGVVAWRTNSVYPTILFHAILNALSLLMTNAKPHQVDWYVHNDHVAPWWIAAGLALVYFGFKGLYRIAESDTMKQSSL